MINSKGETIYTNAEIAYELGLSPTTINAVGRRLFGGGHISHWTLNDAKLIAEYIKSISIDEDAKRLGRLHEVLSEVTAGTQKMTDEEARNQIRKDIHLKEG